MTHKLSGIIIHNLPITIGKGVILFSIPLTGLIIQNLSLQSMC